jgi:hypothetical protein
MSFIIEYLGVYVQALLRVYTLKEMGGKHCNSQEPIKTKGGSK